MKLLRAESVSGSDLRFGLLVIFASLSNSRVLYAHVYESPSFVKKERIIRASVNLPFVYPSIGVSLAPVGCFEVALAAPSVYEPKAQ